MRPSPNDATIVGKVDNSGDATFDNNASIGKDVTNSDNAIFTHSGTIGGMVTNSDSAALTLEAGSSVTGFVVNQDNATVAVTGDSSALRLVNQSSNANAVTIAAGVTLTTDRLNTSAGTVDIDGILTGDLNIFSGGTVALGATGMNTAVVEGTVNNEGTLNFAENSSSEIGTTMVPTELWNQATMELASGASLTVNGNFQNDGSATLNSGTSMTVTGTTFNTASDTLDILAGSSFTGNVDNLSGGALNVAATGLLNGGVYNRSGGTFDLDGSVTDDGTVGAGFAVLNGSVLNEGTMTFAGQIDGNLENRGGATVTVDGTANVDGNIENTQGGTFTIDNDLDWGTGAGDTFTNFGDVTIAAGTTATGDFYENLNNDAQLPRGSTTLEGTLVSDVTNTDAFLRLVNGSSLDGDLTQGARGFTSVAASGGTAATGSITGNFSDTGGAVYMQDGSADDLFNVTGNGSLAGTEIFTDLDIAGANSDVLNFGGNLSGNGVVNFNILGAAVGIDENGIEVVTVTGSNSASFTSTGLDGFSGGALAYSFEQDADTGNYAVFSTINPGIGGLAGTVVSVQSIIGSVINRPSSPFVSGLVNPGEDPCGYGGWVRGTGGRITADNAVETTDLSSGSSNSTTNTIEASYSGLQFGGDVACFDERYGGWNLSLGVIGGINRGESSQDIFRIDPNTGEQDSSVVTSITEADFEQIYGGVYLAGIKGLWAVDLQYRIENTEFELSNRGQNGFGGLGLDDQKIDSRGQTLSGSVSRDFPIEGTDYSVTPVAGLLLHLGGDRRDRLLRRRQAEDRRLHVAGRLPRRHGRAALYRPDPGQRDQDLCHRDGLSGLRRCDREHLYRDQRHQAVDQERQSRHFRRTQPRRRLCQDPQPGHDRAGAAAQRLRPSRLPFQRGYRRLGPDRPDPAAILIESLSGGNGAFSRPPEGPGNDAESPMRTVSGPHQI